MATQTGALRKRQQIDKAGRMMFIWIAIAAAVVGMSAVGAVFIGQKLLFNQKVMMEKQKTVSTLRKNITNVEELSKNILALNSNEKLVGLTAKESDKPLQVVLDALPAYGNSPALGASLKDKLFAGVNGLTVETISVKPTASEAAILADGSTTDTNAGETTTTLPDGVEQIEFDFEVKGNLDAFRELLQRLERSIRTIDVTALSFEGADDRNQLTLRVSGVAYYQLTRTVDLTEKEVKP